MLKRTLAQQFIIGPHGSELKKFSGAEGAWTSVTFSIFYDVLLIALLLFQKSRSLFTVN